MLRLSHNFMRPMKVQECRSNAKTAGLMRSCQIKTKTTLISTMMKAGWTSKWAATISDKEKSAIKAH